MKSEKKLVRKLVNL